MIESTYQKYRDAGFDHESAMRAALIQSSAPQPPERPTTKARRPSFFTRLIAILKGTK
jgi:hypothetical protein